MEWLKAERARTSPSRRVTATQTSAPSRRARRVRLAVEPWTYSTSPDRAWIVGMILGEPSTRVATWQYSASSRMASIVARSYAPRSGWRLTVVRGVTGSSMAPMVRARGSKSIGVARSQSSVRGSRTRKVAPPPGVVTTSTRPR